MTVQPERFAFAGSGAVAQTLARLLMDAGANVVAIASRNRDHAQAAADWLGPAVRVATYEQLPEFASHIVVAVEDSAIGELSRILSSASSTPAIVVHTCGAKGPDALDALRRRGSSCGVMHPLQTIPDRERGIRAIAGATFAVGGDEAAADWGGAVARQLGAVPMRVAADGFPLYHAGAALAGNGAFALVETAVSLLTAAGVERARAIEALAPLCRRSIDNALTAGPRALTGPVARGSVETVAAHFAALRAQAPGAELLYRATNVALTSLALDNGLEPAAARELLDVLSS